MLSNVFEVFQLFTHGNRRIRRRLMIDYMINIVFSVIKSTLIELHTFSFLFLTFLLFAVVGSGH